VSGKTGIPVFSREKGLQRRAECGSIKCNNPIICENIVFSQFSQISAPAGNGMEAFYGRKSNQQSE
jgi:hypothetical protein